MPDRQKHPVWRAGKGSRRIVRYDGSWSVYACAFQVVEIPVAELNDTNGMCWSDAYHEASNNRGGLLTVRNK